MKRKISQTTLDKNKKNFIDKSNKIHNFKFNYDKVVYLNEYTDVTVTCSIHGDFNILPANHIRKNGCKFCTNPQLLDTNSFIIKANKKHKNKYDYSQVKYISTHKKVKIICPNHNAFFQSPHEHLRGNECKKCNCMGWRKTTWINLANKKKNPSIVYIIRCFNNNEEFIKIGKTCLKTNIRFNRNNLPYSYEIIKEIKGSPDFVWDKEIELQIKYKNERYNPKLPFNGKTECFSIDIINNFI